MFNKILRFDGEEVNGCRVVSVSFDGVQEFPFCTDVIVLDEKNQMGIEFNWDVRIRVDGVVTTDLGSFIKMMDTLVIIAKRFGYSKLYFADDLTDDMLEMFMCYGFTETRVLGDEWNHYLDYCIAEEDVR